MKEKAKYILLPILAAVIVIGAALFLWHARDNSLPEETSATAETADPLTVSEIGASSYYCITVESEETEQITEEDTIAKARAFSHKIYNPNYAYIGTLTTVAAGTADGESCKMASVSGELSDEQMDGLTLSEHLSGDTGTVVLYLNQVSVCHFQYLLYPDGTVEFL